MHALHHPHVPRALTVTTIAAVLAIVLSLGLATGLNDLASTAAPTGAAPLRQAPATSPAWALSPFTRLLPAPVAVPWAPTRP